MKPRPWYRRKRVLLPLGSLAALLLATVIAVVRSDISRIIVYNETGAPLAALRLTACGQSKTFPNVPAEASIRWKLEPHGSPSEIGLEVATEPPIQWRGASIEAHGGRHVTLRIWPDGQIEEHRQISFWQRWVKGAPDLNQ
jgi:hypothetical protein